MSQKTDSQLKIETDNVIKVNGNREITPPLDNALRTNIIDSKINKEGGNVITNLIGYTTELTPTDPRHLVPLKTLEDALSGVSITTDATPTNGSTNPVQSNGVFDALANKLNLAGGTMTGNITMSDNVSLESPDGLEYIKFDGDDIELSTGTGEVRFLDGVSFHGPVDATGDAIYASNIDTFSGVGTVLDLGAGNADTINIGSAGKRLNIGGTITSYADGSLDIQGDGVYISDGGDGVYLTSDNAGSGVIINAYNNTGIELNGADAGSGIVRGKLVIKGDADEGSAIYTDNSAVTKTGIQYAGDYSAGFTSRSLPDVEFVEDAISASVASALADPGAVIKNLIYDPQFEEIIIQEGDTITQPKFLWWSFQAVGLGTHKKQIAQNVDGARGSTALVSTSTNGAGSYLEQMIWFWNIPEFDYDSVFSLGVKVKSSASASVKITADFLDRNGNVNSLVTGSSFESSATIGTSFTELKLENLSIPKVINTSGSPTTYEFTFGIRLRFQVNTNNVVAEFVQPMVNLGSTLRAYRVTEREYREFRGLENFVYKILAKQNVSIAVHGDSLSRAGDTSQTGTGTSYLSLIETWLEDKFKIAVTRYNNACDGSSDPLAMATLEKMTLAHNPDLVFLSNMRNTSSSDFNGTTTNRLSMVESIIRRIKNHNINTDIFLLAPFYKRLDTGGLTEANWAEFTKDSTHVIQNSYLSNIYRTANLNTANIYARLGYKGTWPNLFGTNVTTAGGEITHPNNLGRLLMKDQFIHAVAGAMRSVANYFGYQSSVTTTRVGAVTADMEDVVTIYPDQFVNGTVDGVTVTMNGTWVVDPNMLSDGTFKGSGIYASGTGLGEYPQAMKTSAQGDYIELSWTGKHFGIWFLHSNNREIAKITIDGNVYNFTTLQGSAPIFTNSYPTYATFLGTANNPNSISLSEGAHTLRIEQATAGANKEISIGMIVVF